MTGNIRDRRTIAVSDRFEQSGTTTIYAGFSTSGDITESRVQSPCPVDGRIKKFSINVRNYTKVSPPTVILRNNGGDVGTILNPSGNGVFSTGTLNVPVAKGNLLSIRASSTSTGACSIVGAIAIYTPDKP